MAEERKKTKDENERDTIITVIAEALEHSPELLRALKFAIKRLEQRGELRL